MNIIETFNRIWSTGIISHLVKSTGMSFGRINAGMRDSDFTPEEISAMEKGLIEWERKHTSSNS